MTPAYTYPAPHTPTPSTVERWWRQLDKPLLQAIVILLGFGVVMVLASSPAVSSHITRNSAAGRQEWMLASRHFMIMPLGVLLMLGVSFLPVKWVRRLGVLMLLAVFGLLVLTLGIGMEVKGAKRWLRLPGFSLQAAEFLKPAMAITCAWFFSCWREQRNCPGWLVGMVLYAIGAGLLILQPDFGQTVVLTAVFFTQFFIAGFPVWLIGVFIPFIIVGGIVIYHTLPHVQSRIDRFIDPESGDTYQVEKSMQAFANGGFFGQGPGEGKIKYSLPDAHADFVFPVLAEEYGFIGGAALLVLLLFIFWRGIKHAVERENLFVLLALSGLLVQCLVQAFIHIASSLGMIPTKGMTLPFISYGGSSMLAWGIGFGMILALTRKGT